MKKFFAIAAIGTCFTACETLTVSFAIALAKSPSSQDTSDYVSSYACEKAVKSLLRDPDSLQVIETYGEGYYGWRGMHFRARNGFGGYASGYAKCTLQSDQSVTAAMLGNSSNY